ncbi:MAG: ATP-binding protein [Lachnospiraceae bacterium]|nr:ATP-binding protein [Lachnospiraceae bacterium]
MREKVAKQVGMADSAMISKLFFRLLPIQILLGSIWGINSIVDGLIGSNAIGKTAMAVIGLFFPVTKILDTISVVMLGGSQILCGQYLGREKVNKATKIFSLDMIVIVLVTALVSVVCVVVPTPLAKILGADSESIVGLKQYIIGYAPGIMASLLSAHLSAFLQIEKREKRTYIGIAVMGISNVLLDLFLVVKLQMGLFGLGLATSISLWLFVIVLGAYYFSGKSLIKFTFKELEIRDLWDIIKVGFPGAVLIFVMAIRGVFLNAILLNTAGFGPLPTSGSDAISALSALNTFGSLLYAATAGVANATRLLISVYIGEEDRAGIYYVMRTALIKGVALVAAVSVVVIVFASLFTSCFYRDPDTNLYKTTCLFFRIYPFSMPLSAISVIFVNYFQSSSRMKIVNILSVMDGGVGVIVSSLVLAPFLGSVGVWIAHVLHSVFNLITIFIYTAIVDKKVPVTIEDYLSLPKDYGVKEENKLDISIGNISEVTNISEKVIDFCEEHKVEYKRSYYSGLCIEEMCNNIFYHGFKKGRHSVDVRVIYKPEELLIRIKDDGVAFNPEEFYQLLNPEDVTKNIGIRMIERTKKSMNYQYMLGLNVLTVRY